MPRTFLRSFLTLLTNFDVPTAHQIEQAFVGRTGNNALVPNTGGNNPTPKSKE